MSDDLITWLRDQLDEDERVAEAAVGLGDREVFDPYGYLEGQYVEHITRWDPTRILAEVDAKRRILDRHTMKTGEHVTHGICAECGGSDWKPGVSGAGLDPFPWVMPWPCPTLKLLALPYAAAPGYMEEWRPA